ncbi:hypothetical protein [Geobacillus sp. Manikaran-105]|uniref:hypothetical protein n=1 Tax=Geobacillus sp. Manikaran-105 TaxID=2055940 RepID=UPI001E3B9F6A|nr:hypothetical protein [Geobacillus sp. Manikaran-105]
MAKKMKAWITTIRQLFSSEELTRLARKVGFIQRQRSLTAEAFLTLCAWGDGSLACQSLQRLCADLALWHDCSLSNEGLNQRFTPRAVAFLKEVLPVCSASDFSPSHGGRMGKTAGVCAEKGKKEREGAVTPNP